MNRLGWIACFFLTSGVWASTSDSPFPSGDVAIQSDELQILNRGAQTRFVGHVRMTRDQTVVVADRMTQTRATGIIDIDGHIRADWTGIKKDRASAVAAQARYDAEQKTLEWWGNPELTYWPNAVDNNPLLSTAKRFLYHQPTQVIQAREQVVMQQQDRFRMQSDEAKYDNVEQTLYAWGTEPVQLELTDPQVKGQFKSDRLTASQSPRVLRMTGNVRGRVNPQ